MLIREFIENIDLKNMDLRDDLEFFMRSDPVFYRKAMYPIISKLKASIKNNKPCREDIFRSCVDRASEIYCKKFKIPNDSKSVFTDVDRDEIARKIFSKEKEYIQQGKYDE
jgi:hypothetical protein